MPVKIQTERIRLRPTSRLLGALADQVDICYGLLNSSGDLYVDVMPGHNEATLKRCGDQVIVIGANYQKFKDAVLGVYKEGGKRRKELEKILNAEIRRFPDTVGGITL